MDGIYLVFTSYGLKPPLRRDIRVWEPLLRMNGARDEPDERAGEHTYVPKEN